MAQATIAAPFIATLVAAAAIDLRRRMVPNRLLAPAAVWAVAATAVAAPDQLTARALAGALAFLVLLVPALARPGALGMGDVKLAGVMGLYLGVEVVPAIVAAFVGGAALGVALLLAEGPAARGRTLPFAPFLAGGGIVGLVGGTELIELYLRAVGGP